MKNRIFCLAMVGFCSITSSAFADAITDNYSSGDTLTAQTLDNIKAAVNGSDARIIALEAQVQSLQDALGIAEATITQLQTNLDDQLSGIVTVFKNDSFIEGGSVSFQGGFVTGDAGAAKFDGLGSDYSVERIQLLFGGTTTAQDVTIVIYEADGIGGSPGTIIYSSMFQLQGTALASFHNINLASENIQVSAGTNIFIAAAFAHDGLPSLATDQDGIQADKNWVFLGGLSQWVDASGLGVLGDFVIRAELKI